MAPLLLFNTPYRESQPMRSRRTLVRLRNPKGLLHFHDSTLVDLGQASEKSSWFSNLRTVGFISHAQAFGREPNALPKLCNCLMQKNFGSPGRIRTSNISVNSRNDRKSKCPIWCRLRKTGSHFSSFSCTHFRTHGRLREHLLCKHAVPLQPFHSVL